MNILTINGERFKVEGTRVSVSDVKNSTVTISVNGKTIKTGLSGTVNIRWEGDLATLSCNTATVNGNVNGPLDANTVNVKGSVRGNIDANTVSVGGDVSGDVDANTMNCRNHTGKIKL